MRVGYLYILHITHICGGGGGVVHWSVPVVGWEGL